MQRGRSSVSLSDLMGAGLLRPGQELCFRHSGEVAVVTDSGALRLRGNEYHSPSTAGQVITGGPNLNGWMAWYVTSDGERASLATLRARLLEAWGQ